MNHPYLLHVGNQAKVKMSGFTSRFICCGSDRSGTDRPECDALQSKGVTSRWVGSMLLSRITSGLGTPCGMWCS